MIGNTYWFLGFPKGGKKIGECSILLPSWR